MADVSAAAGHTSRHRRRVLVTGRSRSGTTLLTRLLDAQRDLFVANDILQTPFDVARRLDHMRFDVPLIAPRRADLGDGITNELKQRAPWGPHAATRFTTEQAGLTNATLDEVYGAATRALHAEREGADGPSVWIGHKRNSVGDVIPALLRDTDVVVVYVLRDVRDVMHSMQSFCATTGEPFRPKTLVNGWVRETRLIDGLRRHPRVHSLRFEDLVRDPAGTCASLSAFFGVPVDHTATLREASGEPWLSNTTFGDVHAAFDPTVLQRWRSAPSPEVAYAQKRAAALLAEHGYTERVPVSPRVRAKAARDNAKFWLRGGRR